MYTGMVTMSYFNPYLVKVFNVSAVFAGIYGAVAAYVLRIAAGPVSGFIMDFTLKGRASSFMITGFCASAAACLIMLLASQFNTSLIIICLVSLVFCFFGLAMRSTYTVLFEEAGLPRNTTGAVVSVACFIGLLPTLAGYPLCGYLLDHLAGETGFKAIWAISAVCMIGGLLSIKLLRNYIVSRNAIVVDNAAAAVCG